MIDFRKTGIAELAQRIETRQLSPVEVTEAAIARIEAAEPSVNAYITRTFDRARTRAKAAEAEIIAGRYRGPMHGIPYALKDVFDVAGVRTTAHSARLRNRVPDADCAVAERLDAAGAILTGKLATHEFATGGPSWDLPFPPARNPWGPGRYPGGSSSGSGAAVAAGMVPLAIGSDTGGSIRLPAAFCGTVGLKPTFGRISRRGMLPLGWVYDNAGPLTWRIEDTAIALNVLAGHDPADPSSAREPIPDFTAGLHDGIAGMRIGLIRHFYEEDQAASPEVAAAMEEAVRVLTGLGAEVVEVRLRPSVDYQACFRLINIVESFAIHETALRDTPELYGEVTRYRLSPGAFVSGVDYVQALRTQRILLNEALAAMEGVDALVTATIPAGAPLMGGMMAQANFARPPMTNAFNVTGFPAIALCNGFNAEGMPLSMQIAARPFEEATMFRIAQAYETATAWRDRFPADQQGQPPPDDRTRAVPDLALPAEEAARWTAYTAALRWPLEGQRLAEVAQVIPYTEAMAARLERPASFHCEPSTVHEPFVPVRRPTSTRKEMPQ